MRSEIQVETAPDLTVLVESALARNFTSAGRNLRFEVHQEQVVLRGRVRSYYQKQLAQETLKQIQGVRQIQNEIEVG